jgi:hypothetical protein
LAFTETEIEIALSDYGIENSTENSKPLSESNIGTMPEAEEGIDGHLATPMKMMVSVIITMI